MRKIIASAMLLAALLGAARAADNAVVVTPGTGLTMCSKDIGAGVQAMCQILVGTNGTAIYGTAGTANANVLTVQGVASMTPLLATATLAAETTKVIGTVNQGTSPWVTSATIADGADVTLGAKADPACSTDNGTCTLEALAKRTNQNLTTLNTSVTAPIPAGTNVIGHVIADTGSTTAVTQATAANLNATVVGSGSAGTANAGVLTVQGIASMTPLLANPGTAANWSVVAVAAAPPANANYGGVLSGGATGGLIRGQIACDSHKFVHVTSATDTLLVQGVTSQTVYICGWRSRAAGVATWFLENTASANANCSSSNTQIGGVATEAANTGEVVAPVLWAGFKNTVSNGLCLNSTGIGGFDFDLWYAQF